MSDFVYTAKQEQKGMPMLALHELSSSKLAVFTETLLLLKKAIYSSNEMVFNFSQEPCLASTRQANYLTNIRRKRRQTLVLSLVHRIDRPLSFAVIHLNATVN